MHLDLFESGLARLIAIPIGVSQPVPHPVLVALPMNIVLVVFDKQPVLRGGEGTLQLRIPGLTIEFYAIDVPVRFH